MASPQHENGHLKIADDLVVAICRERFSAAQLKILLAVMNMTYRVNKTKASISPDDLRYATGEKRYTIETELDKLIHRKVVYLQHLTNGIRVIGFQKDYDMWLPKNGNANTSNLNVINNISTRRELPNFGNKGNHNTPPGRILTWMLKELNITLGTGAWRKEYSNMVKLYTTALDIAHEPKQAMQALRDYFDYLDNPSFRAKVTRPASYLNTGFHNWYKSLPPKTRDVAEQEEIMGYRYRYNLNNRRWEQTSGRI